MDMSKTATENNTVFCVCMTSGGKLGPSRICQGIFYFVCQGIFYFVFSKTSFTTLLKELLHTINVGHPGAIHGQGINFFPCVRRPSASCLKAKCLSSEIISERLACSCQSWQCPPWETSISSEVLPVGGSAVNFMHR